MKKSRRAVAIIIRNNKLLILHRIRQGREYVVLPGGGVEDGETVEEALVREVKEETGLDVRSFTRDGSYVNKQDGREHVLFQVKVEDGEPVLGGPEREKLSKENWYEFAWVTVEELEKLDMKPEENLLIIRTCTKK